MVLLLGIIYLFADRQLQKLIRDSYGLPHMLKSLLNKIPAEEAVYDSDYEDESDAGGEEGNEVINLARSAVALLRKLPPSEEVERAGSLRDSGKGRPDSSGTLVEETHGGRLRDDY
jgi:hypothetical protein